MYETEEDLERLQKLLDSSYSSAGTHLLRIHTEGRRLTADRLAPMLTGVRILSLATVSSSGEPIAGPVDGLFYRGRFWFGSAPDSVRFRHIRARPAVSASHTVGEELAIVVHGTAREIDVTAPENAGFRDYLLEIYGKDQASFVDGHPYAVIEPRRMFAFHMPPA